MKNAKVCRRGLNDIWINENDGKVRICGWSNYFIGCLTENTIEELWNGELAQKFRESMLDGSYRYCSNLQCPYLANDKLEEILVDYEVPSLPKFCSLSYQLQCNYVCRFCRSENYIPCNCEKENYIKIEKEIKKIFPFLETVSSNGAGEFFCSDSIIRLIQEEELKDDVKISIETNGSLFNEVNWKKIEKLGEHDLSVAVTVHSFNEDTYQYLSGTKLPVKQVMDNLAFISELRKQGIINELEIGTVVCERNFREMPEFVKTCLEKYEMDTIRLRFFEPGGSMDTATEWFYDIRNEYHPYYDEFVKVMSDPVLHHPKVWKWQGETKSLQKENPYILEKRRGYALSRLVLLENASETLAKFFAHHNIKKIALYGAGKVAYACVKILKNDGVEVNTVFDTYIEPKGQDGIIIRKPEEDLLASFDLIIITVDTFAERIKENLKRMQYKGKVMLLSEMMDDIERNGGCE